MRKILVLAFVLLASTAFGRQAALYVGTGAEAPDIWDGSPGDAYFGAAEVEMDGELRCDGAVTLGDAPADVITVTGTLTLQAASILPPGTAALPSLVYVGSLTTGYYQTAADELGISVATANVGTWDGTGLIAVGFNGPLGTTVPAQVEATNVYGNGLHYFGDGPEDLHQGYRDRSEHIMFQDDFTGGVQATYDAKWTTAGVVGAGTNTPTVRPGWSELVTGGAGGPDMESTVSILAEYVALGEPRLEAVVDIAVIAATTQRFEIGFYIGAAELVEIVYDTAIGPNWTLEVDDTTGMEQIDSGVAVVAATPTKLEIQVDAAGDVHWAIDDVAMTEVGLVNIMTANPFSIRWMITDIAAVVHTVAVDYVQVEQLKQQ